MCKEVSVFSISIIHIDQLFSNYICNFFFIHSKKRETRDRDGTEKQWTEIETETNKTVDNDMVKKNGEEKTLSTTTASSADESLPKVNPIKWTVNEISLYLNEEIYLKHVRNDQRNCTFCCAGG